MWGPPDLGSWNYLNLWTIYESAQWLIFFLEIGSILEMRSGGESGLKMRGYKECEGQNRAEVTHTRVGKEAHSSKRERPSPRNTRAKLSVLMHLLLLASQRVKSLKTQGLA